MVAAAPGGPGTGDPVPSRSRWPGRVLGMLLAVTLLVALVVVGLTMGVASHLTRIEGAFDGLGRRPAQTANETIVMIGTRLAPVDEVPWLPGDEGVESVMVVDIAADRRSVSVTALPLRQELLGATTSERPAAAVAVVEEQIGWQVDHLMAVDWQVLSDLATANGVENGYRFGSARRAQLDFLDRLLDVTLHTELRSQPVTLYRHLRLVAGGLAVDDDWSLLELELLVLSLRDLRSAHIVLTAAAP